MNRILALFVLISLFIGTTKANTYTGNLLLSNQTQINDILTDGYTKITGNFYISGSNITDLSPLLNLDSIGGNFRINNNPRIQSLEGLSGLSYINGNFSIKNNDSLTDVSALMNLTRVGGDLTIGYHHRLDSVFNLTSLQYIGNDLNIMYNDDLVSIEGLSSINHIGGKIEIYSNDELTSIAALSQVDSCESINLIGYSLQNLHGLHNMTYIEFGLSIRFCYDLEDLNDLNSNLNCRSITLEANHSLTSLSGLEGIIKLEGDVLIRNNNNLVSLNGIHNIDSIGGDLEIRENNILPSISELNGLNYCRGGLLVFANPALTSLVGLSGITNDSLMGGLTISNNPLINTLVDLPDIRYVDGNVHITYLPLLESLEGLNNLESITGNLAIQNNLGLTTIAQLSNLTQLSNNLMISSNNSLTSILGLEGINTVPGVLNISVLPELVNLQGLSGLQSVGSYLTIEGIPRLKDLLGLENLTHITDNIYIKFNDSLKTLNGLENLVTTNRLNIFYNNSLENYCAISNVSYTYSPIIHSNYYSPTNIQLQNGFCAQSICNTPLYVEEQDTVVCEGSTVLFGNSTYTQSGIYTDTVFQIANTTCDSIVHILNMEVIPTVNTVFESICEGDSILIAGSYVSSNGVYSDSLTNNLGCDSIVLVNVSVILQDVQLTTTLCYGEAISVGTSIYTETGNYIDTLTNSLNCDSIVYLNLEINPVEDTSIVETLCFGDTMWVGNTPRFVNGTFTDTLSTTLGCDSIIQLALTVLLPDTQLVDQTICYGDSLFFNGDSLNVPGTYTYMLVNQNGCDSLVSLHLNVLPEAYQISDTICGGDAYNIGLSTYTETGNYTDTLMSTIGCDSIVWLNLKVNTIDLSVENNSNILQAIQGNAVYQWINCTSNTSLANGNQQSYTAVENGEYAVEITQNGCVDTSDCILIMGIGLEEYTKTNLLIYQQKQSLVIESKTNERITYFVLVDALGRQVLEHNPNQSVFKTDIAHLKPGVYFVQAQVNTTFKQIKIIVN